MKPKVIFDLVARTAGLFILLLGMGHILAGMSGIMGLYPAKFGSYEAFCGMTEIVTGYLVMRGIVPVAEIAFPPMGPAGHEAIVQDSKPEQEVKTPDA